MSFTVFPMRKCVGVWILPAADNEASHQEYEETDSSCYGHSQDGELVGVSNGQNIYVDTNTQLTEASRRTESCWKCVFFFLFCIDKVNDTEIQRQGGEKKKQNEI